MKTIYYYYYLFYKNILKDTEPHLLTIFALSFTEILFFYSVLEIFLAIMFCYFITRAEWIVMCIIITAINFLYFHSKGKGKQIVKLKPTIFSRAIFSAIFSAMVFLISFMLFMFSGTLVHNYMLCNCK